MLPLTPQIKWLDEYQERERIDEPLTGAELGPQPWCRLCQKGVDDWIWCRLPNGRWHIAVRCHRACCAGLLPATTTPWNLRVETFCFSEPHLKEAPVWFVQWDGSVAQPARAYLDAAIARGGHMQRIHDWSKNWMPVIAMGISWLLYLLAH